MHKYDTYQPYQAPKFKTQGKRTGNMCGELTVLAGALTPMANVSVENKTYIPK